MGSKNKAIRFIDSEYRELFCMLYRDDTGAVKADWTRFQRAWVWPEIVLGRLKTNQ